MVYFIALLKPTKYGDRRLYRRLLGINRLEAPLQRLVGFDVLSVLIQGGCPDGVQLTPAESRLDEVRGIGGTFTGPRPDDGVQFIDEQDDPPFAGRHFLYHCFQAFLELSPKLRSCDQGSDIETEQAFMLQGFRDIPRGDAQGEPLDDGGFSHTGFTDENRIVLGLS